ncbi:bifunctional riboflavin kinase/FMN adenylyltransferase [Lutibacter profundi]|uniref:Riboflavin biosynthesis protein n=1 Tax=Lutibacter profundi TaxID=1622118 RepID=A0A0X8G6R7_9FLAO|nr:bifunctional riboflavin kinase/FAD synthetase [Lutibacter profundi]AMC11131.1 bifunctional riboflavin kinase/FMN adenylyltransferase [Lutibacter profundi]
MEIINDLSTYKSTAKTFVTIGTFDGVHIGHQKVLKNLVESAKINNATPLLLTFFPHPRMVLEKDKEIKLINTIDERIELLKKTDLEFLIIQKFTKEYANKTALNFVKNILVDTLNISKLIIGYDHQFGKNREGDFSHLKEYGQQFNFTVEEISQLNVDSITVSSTKIRKAIEKGEIEKANNYLGYNFMLTGKVVKGRNLGEKIKFPTANLSICETYKLIPKTGAYIVKSEIENNTVFGMMNIGYRPTVSGKHQTIEIHFFDFNKNLYGAKIQIEVLKFLRNEQNFKSIENLKTQLQKDKQKSLKYINGLLFDY